MQNDSVQIRSLLCFCAKPQKAINLSLPPQRPQRLCVKLLFSYTKEVAQKFEFQVTAKDFKKRLDEFLFAEFPHLSRLYLRELVRDEKCEVNGRWENRGYLLKTNDFIEVEVDRTRQTSLQPEAIPLEINFEDTEFLVVNKRAG